MVQKILRRLEIKPFKIKYYCEKRDPEFEQKMHDVLLVYKQISLQFHEDGSIIVPEDGLLSIQFPAMKNPEYRRLQRQGTVCVQQRIQGVFIVTQNINV